MGINYVSLGDRLRQIRKRRGLSQMALAEEIDCATTYISYLETGQKSMSLATFVALANALHVSADELLLDSLDNTLVVMNHEFASLMADCTDYERRVLFDVVAATKQALRTNRPFFQKRGR